MLQLLAETLDSAAASATAIPQISLSTPISIDDAYEIQRLSIDKRLARGEKLVGLKMGFTSVAKMEQMGVHDMIWGRLTDAMLLKNGGELQMSNFIHPRAEPEICFRISKDINTELTLEECFDVVDGMAAAIEVIDSRYENFKFSLADVIADNCSSAAFVVGEWLKPEKDIKNLLMTMQFDGVEVATGSSNDILGNPWLSLQAATRLAAQYNQPIAAGSYILAGAATNAEFIKPNSHVSAAVGNWKSIAFHAIS